ncbi:sugar transferase [uncultured Ruthenibacterium sp.]|uniref:sugar transferase n=1 Tax=uncultured Ruthenibacterium sp. TaxID=1905347 RepID=UPI00349EFEBD
MENSIAVESAQQPKARSTAQVVPNTSIAYRFLKRAFDITASLCGLVILSPVFLITALAIYIEDPGSVFFGQPRIGKNKKTFKMLKFRSMCKDAEERLKNLSAEQKLEFSQNFKLKNDPRITKVGKFIRKTSIDELPQLVNILKGDMSVVGPRPPLLIEEESYGEHLDSIMSVRPGLTGYWQVNGRSDTDFSERIAMNEFYIAHRSLWLDIKIIFQTFSAIFTGKGAI